MHLLASKLRSKLCGAVSGRMVFQMNEKRFWEIIDRSKDESYDRHFERYRNQLLVLNTDELTEFKVVHMFLKTIATTRKISEAAYLVIVILDHESILQFSKIKILSTLASSFEELIKIRYSAAAHELSEQSDLSRFEEMTKGFCWRCQQFVVLITDADTGDFDKLYFKTVENAKQYRQQHNLSFYDTPFDLLFEPVYEFYRKLGGDPSVGHHEIRMHCLIGPKCPGCGKNFRTQSASFCAECGHRREIHQD